MKNVYIYIAIAVVAAGVAGFGGYQSGYSKGYGEAKVESEKAIQEIRDILARKEAEEKNSTMEGKKLIEEQKKSLESMYGNW